MRGDIAVALNEGATEAGQWYSEGYSSARREDSPLLMQFQARQQSLSNDTYDDLTPSPELETPRLVPSSSKPSGTPKNITVVLDPGHGGDDPGAVGSEGLLEKEITMDVALRIKSLLTPHNIRVVLTRETDTFLPLARRTRIANHQEGDVFVSLHVNASPSHKLTGLETYYLDNTDDQAGRKLAERENSVSGVAVDDLSYILGDLIQSGKLEDSIRFARVLDRELVSHVAGAGRGVTSKGVKKGPFFVLVGAHMPCVLVEMLFVDNPDDARKLNSPAFRKQLSQGIAKGILRFVAPAAKNQSRHRVEVSAPKPRTKVTKRKRK
jgi:N-acetylmuramoyl-L-alanine amidase